MISYARTDTGRARKMNQDSLFASSAPVGMLPNLHMVADGMGGHKAGDYASRFVSSLIVSRTASANVKKRAHEMKELLVAKMKENKFIPLRLLK